MQTDIFHQAKFGIKEEQEYPINLINPSNDCSSQPNHKPASHSTSGGGEDPAIQLPILTRIIYPIDNQLYWALHPCNTQDVLKEILNHNPAQLPQPLQIIECFFSLLASLVKF